MLQLHSTNFFARRHEKSKEKDENTTLLNLAFRAIK